MVSGTDLSEGTLVDVQLSVGDRTETVQAEVIGGRIGVVANPAALQGVDTVGVLVQQPGSDAVYVYEVPVQPLTDVCTAEGGIALARDCAAPDAVLATVEASGLTAGGTYGIAVVGTSPSGQQVELASADVVSVDGTLAGTLPLLSATGTVPLDGFTGLALLVDGQVFASVGVTDAVVGTCVVPQPLPVAPAHPVASTSPAAGAHPAQPAALAQTGTEASSLLLLAGAFLVVGGLTTLLARRTAR
ncbi:hypothetical protein GCM10011381_38760 [Klenkia taihuensis]|nr:hypothetical protein GCM10011381_38760 [Klenkia taihuensis]